MKSTRLIKEAQNYEENIKNLKKYHQNLNDRKLKIHRNKIEWVVPRNRNVKKTTFVHITTSFI